MLASHRIPSFVILAAATLGGCAIPTTSTQLNPGPEPIELQMTPTVIYAGQQAELVVRSPGADSLVVASENGLDRYWSSDSVLRVTLTSDFGDPAPAERYAPEWKGQALPYLKKPVHVTACRQGRCREFYHEIAIKLPERNRRVVAVTAGWSSVFARRSIRDGHRTVLFQDALTSGAWSLQGEWSAGGWNGRVPVASRTRSVASSWLVPSGMVTRTVWGSAKLATPRNTSTPAFARLARMRECSRAVTRPRRPISSGTVNGTSFGDRK